MGFLESWHQEVGSWFSLRNALICSDLDNLDGHWNIGVLGPEQGHQFFSVYSFNSIKLLSYLLFSMIFVSNIRNVFLHYMNTVVGRE